MRIAVKWASYILLGLLGWLITHFFVSLIARETVRFFAFSITESYAFPSCGDGCRKFVWDAPLKFAVYTSYGIVLSTYIAWLSLFLRFDVPAASKRCAKILFILLFPCYTSWGVHSECGGFGPCAVGYSVDIFVPVILSTNVIYMAISVALAWGIFEAYSRLCRKMGYLS